MKLFHLYPVPPTLLSQKHTKRIPFPAPSCTVLSRRRVRFPFLFFFLFFARRRIFPGAGPAFLSFAFSLRFSFSFSFSLQEEHQSLDRQPISCIWQPKPLPVIPLIDHISLKGTKSKQVDTSVRRAACWRSWCSVLAMQINCRSLSLYHIGVGLFNCSRGPVGFKWGGPLSHPLYYHTPCWLGQTSTFTAPFPPSNDGFGSYKRRIRPELDLNLTWV